MLDNLALQAKLTKELVPPGAHGPVTNNFYLSTEYLTMLRVATPPRRSAHQYAYRQRQLGSRVCVHIVSDSTRTCGRSNT
jgi:hypothetical protein